MRRSRLAWPCGAVLLPAAAARFRKVLLGGVLLAALPAGAQEPGGPPPAPAGEGVLVLKEGRQLPGRILAAGARIRLATAWGEEEIAADRVSGWLPRAGLEAELARLGALPGAGEPFARVQRGLWAFAHGLDAAGWESLGGLLREQPAPPALDRLLAVAAERFRAGLRSRALPKDEAQDLLGRVPAEGEAPARAAQVHVAGLALAELLRREAGRAGGGRPLHGWIQGVAEDGLGANRRRAARQALLHRTGAEQAFVYRLAVRYPEGPRRQAAMADVRLSGRAGEAAGYLGSLLERGGPSLQLRAAEVLESLQSPAALPALVASRARVGEAMRRAAGGGGVAPGPRAYVAMLNQQAYVRDFDVEVASAAFIGDPVVGVLQDGQVLDVTVVNVEIHRYLVQLALVLDRAIAASRRQAAGGAGR